MKKNKKKYITSQSMFSSKYSSDKSINSSTYILSNSPTKNIIDEKKIPKNIGSYNFKEKIFDGSYYSVFKGESIYTKDAVTIKVIGKIFFLENMEELLLIKREIEILKIIKHRNIMTLYEIYESPEFIFIISEYFSGKNLCEMLVLKRRFNEEEAKKIFVQLIDALYYLHNKMFICHRNLSLNTIIFNSKNVPKLINFSYSTFYPPGQELKDGYGSICYACPEIISDVSYNPELSDVWSLGAILYTMVAGYLPFSEENDEKNKDLIINGKIDYPKEMSNKLKDLLRHMMDIEPQRRYNFIKVMKHPWFKPYTIDKLIDGYNPIKMLIPVDIKILNFMHKKFGFDINKIKEEIKSNKYNKATAVYKLLVNKANKFGLSSVSDLESKEYSEFKDNKENYVINCDKKYLKYLYNVHKKLKDTEKMIYQFQEKEENIIKELNNLELSIKEKNNNNIKEIDDKNKDNDNDNILEGKDSKKITKSKSPYQRHNINIKNYKELKKLRSSSFFANSMKSFLNKTLNKNNNNINIKRKEFSINIESFKDTSMVIKRRRSYLNNSTFLESLLKKSHPDNVRRNQVKKIITSDINQVIIEEKEKEKEDMKDTDNNDINNNNIIINSPQKKKSMRYSLSFDENDESITDNEESIEESKIDSKQLSIFDENGFMLVKQLNMVSKSRKYIPRRKLKKPVSNFLEMLDDDEINNNKNNNNDNNDNSEYKYPKLENPKFMLSSIKNKSSNEILVSSNIKTNSNDNNIDNNDNNEVTNFENKKEENFDVNDDLDKLSLSLNSEKDKNNDKESNNFNNKMKEIKEINEIIISQKTHDINIIIDTKKQWNIFNKDKKIISKIKFDDSYIDEFCSINYIHKKFTNKYMSTFYLDNKLIKKLENIDINIDFVNHPKITKNNTNTNTNEIYFIPQINKEQNLLLNSNLNSSTNSNMASNENILKNNDFFKKDNLIKLGFRNNLNNNDNNNIKENKNILSAACALKNKNNKYIKNINHPKNKIKDKIKLVKKLKVKAKISHSDMNYNKYNEDLSFTNISDLSEIKPSSIMSPSYINTNIENKENILLNNNNYNCNYNYIDNKSFQSKSQISYLSMTHENNIFLGNVNTITYCHNNCYDYDNNNPIRKVFNNNSEYIENNNINNTSKYYITTYSKKHILNIKKRNLAEKLKIEIQKSIDKKQIKSSLLISETKNDIQKKDDNIISLSTSNSVSRRENKLKVNKKKINNKVSSTKYIFDKSNNNNYLKHSIPLNGLYKYKSPDYVNFIARRNNLNANANNTTRYEVIKKSNGKSVENKNIKIKSIIKSKSRDKLRQKNDINFADKFYFGNTIQNFNKLNCFNIKRKKEKENGSTINKININSMAKRYCENNNVNIINKDNKNIKSNGKKINMLKEKIPKELCNDNRSSYLNIYEKDKLNKKKSEKTKIEKNQIKNKVKSPLVIDRKKNDYTYRRALFKIYS